MYVKKIFFPPPKVFPPLNMGRFLLKKNNNNVAPFDSAAQRRSAPHFRGLFQKIMHPSVIFMPLK